jgi:hypothetical protein
LQYLLTEAVPLAVFILTGVVFWALGAPTRAKAKAAAAAGASEGWASEG